MSVQVRRRREAASFLASFVGAQGELLVDTTNNRVQVHDGATAGGWPAASIGDLAGRNAGLNTNFAVNQRGYASGTALGAGVYAHDRHKAGAGGCAYTFSQAVPDTMITITAGSLIQAIDGPNVYATSWWLTWTGTAQARVWQGSASGTYGSGVSAKVDGVTVNALFVTGLAVGAIANIEWSTGTLGTTRPWQFEAALSGVGPTRLDRRHGEAMLCQRYYQSMPVASGVWQSSANHFNYAATYPVVMRAPPSVTFVASGSGVTIPFLGNYAVSGLYYVQALANTCFVSVVTANSTVGAIGIAQPDLLIALSSEI